MWDYSKLLPEALSKKAPDLAAMLDPKTDRVAALEDLVHRMLATQHQVADSITERVNAVPGLPKPMLELTEQLHGMAESMLKLQAEVWIGWFGVLRQLQGVDTSQPQVEATKTDAPKPATETPAPKAESAGAEEWVEAAEVVQAPTGTSESKPEVDDLKVINGVGPAIERKLNEAGIFSYRQIASWDDGDVARLEETVMTGRFAGKIRREDWIGQAKTLIG